MSEPSALFEWPKPHGGPPNFTVFQDHSREVEWQRTQHALGRPVDVNALFSVIDRIDEVYDERLDEKDKMIDKREAARRTMVDAIDKAIEDLNRKVRARMSQDIIGKLNKIDRHDVAAVVKEVLAEIDTIQNDMRRASV